jgi:periplasmic divalent cation tolerance protein
MRHKFIEVYVTAPSKAQARRIILALLKRRLVACGSVLDGVDSAFLWKGRIDRAKEVLILLKTRRTLFGRVASEIKKMHSYEVPEIVAIPIVDGSNKYLKWIDEVTKGPSSPSK